MLARVSILVTCVSCFVAASSCGGTTMDVGSSAETDPEIIPPPPPLDDTFTVERACRARGGTLLTRYSSEGLPQLLPGRWVRCPQSYTLEDFEYASPRVSFATADAIDIESDSARPQQGRWRVLRESHDGYERVGEPRSTGTWWVANTSSTTVHWSETGGIAFEIGPVYLEESPLRWFVTTERTVHVFVKLPAELVR